MASFLHPIQICVMGLMLCVDELCLKHKHVLIKKHYYLPVYVSQVSYAIGVAQPLSISLFTYGSSKKTETELLQIVNKNFDLRPGVIVR